MFAKGFVTTPDLSWESNTAQLIVAWVAGALGLVALGWLICLAVDNLRPTLFELADLPPKYVAVINREPRYYLPSSAQNFDKFRNTLEALRKNEVEWRVTVERREVQLTVEKGTTPPDQGRISAVRRELEKATATHDLLVRNLIVYNRVRKSLLDRAGYWQASRGFQSSAWKMAVAAVLAAAGGIGYQLLLAAPPSPTDKNAQPTNSISLASSYEPKRRPAENCGSNSLWLLARPNKLAQGYR